MKKLAILLLLLSGTTYAEPALFQPGIVKVGYSGIPAADIDLNGVYKLVLDADADSYFYSSADDVLDFYASGAVVAQIAGYSTAQFGRVAPANEEGQGVASRRLQTHR